ncbi:NADH dehydrogenase [ubiquinone] 1 beta subcomplex subunit 2 [Paramyrothecium foliicola]|nr:NADH dehydrogenase [ubiquinone] 1 beta subcomplex subunit 2 [Paramyrothecium foliicola]
MQAGSRQMAMAWGLVVRLGIHAINFLGLPSSKRSHRSLERHTALSNPTIMGPPKPPMPHVAPIYRFTATALGAGMWFWIFYRAKKDGPVLLGWKHPWDH